uniref:Ig-like domain-containing protein n=1 Tax=Cyprinus carpio carpio TaxID=630221 RepID=A0A8C1EQQ9_CYPCA
MRNINVTQCLYTLNSNKCCRSVFCILTLYDFFLLSVCVLGVLCGFNINLPQRVEALKGSCVFIPCTFDIEQEYEKDLTDSAKRMWFKAGGSTAVFDSSSPNTGLLKGEIFGTATQKNCTTRFDNVDQSHRGSYYFRLEANGKLKHSYTEPTYSQVQIGVFEGSSVSLRCSTKIFCPSRPPSLTWSSSLIESVTGQQYQNQTELISDLNFTVSHRHHRVTFTCTAAHQLQKQITTQESRLLSVQYAPKNTSVRINPAGLVLEGRSVTLSCSSDANPAVNYTWYRDTERPLNPVQTGPNLTINNTDPTHSGRYYCTAENKHGTQNSSVGHRMQNSLLHGVSTLLLFKKINGIILNTTTSSRVLFNLPAVQCKYLLLLWTSSTSNL